MQLCAGMSASLLLGFAAAVSHQAVAQTQAASGPVSAPAAVADTPVATSAPAEGSWRPRTFRLRPRRPIRYRLGPRFCSSFGAGSTRKARGLAMESISHRLFPWWWGTG